MDTLAAQTNGVRPAALAPKPASLPFEKVKIGLVGLNFGRHIVGEILEGAAREFLEIAALCDTDPRRLADAGVRVKASCYGRLEDLLENPDVEAVGLFTGPLGRAALMRRILRSGRDILTTKPLELDPDAALSVLREAQEAGRVIHCNSPGPIPTTEIQAIENWRSEYRLGRPVGCRADVWTSYREIADGSWYDDPLSCPAAPIYRLGIYLINDLVRLWGPALRVHVTHARLFTQRPTADNAQVSILFANGAIANIFASFCVNDGDQYRNGLTLNFENGTVYRNAGPAWQAQAKSGTHLALVQARSGSRSVVAEMESETGSGEYLWECFARSVRRESRQEALQPEQMVEGIRIMKAISESERSGRPVELGM